jgi:hypothetical protein
MLVIMWKFLLDDIIEPHLHIIVRSVTLIPLPLLLNRFKIFDFVFNLSIPLTRSLSINQFSMMTDGDDDAKANIFLIY